MSTEAKHISFERNKSSFHRVVRPLASLLLTGTVLAAVHKDQEIPPHTVLPVYASVLDRELAHDVLEETGPPGQTDSPFMRQQLMLPGVVHDLNILPTETPTPLPTPEPTPAPKKIEPPQPSGVSAQAVQTVDVDTIVSAMYQQESQSGLTDPCVKSGEGFNGYGYSPGTCYSSHAEVTAKVRGWIMDKIQNGWPLAQALCYYQSGYILSDCDYYRTILSIQRTQR